MARKQSDIVSYNLDLPLHSEHAQVILSLVDDPISATDAQKVGGVAVSLLEKLAGGGLMLTGEEIQRITDATGVDPSCGEDLVEALSNATDIVEGKHRVSVLIDPSYYPGYEEVASIQERPVQELFQETMQIALEQEWAYQLTPAQRPVQILMSPKDKEELEQALEGTFSTGTELAALLRKALGTDGGLFGEDEIPAAEAEAE